MKKAEACSDSFCLSPGPCPHWLCNLEQVQSPFSSATLDYTNSCLKVLPLSIKGEKVFLLDTCPKPVKFILGKVNRLQVHILLPTVVLYPVFWVAFCLYIPHLLSKFTLKSAGVKVSTTAKNTTSQFRRGCVNPIYWPWDFLAALALPCCARAFLVRVHGLSCPTTRGILVP